MVALFMPQMWVAFAHVVSLKFRSCSTVKRSCFQMWLLDIPWRVLYKSLLAGPNLQRFWFRGLTQGPGSCIESQPIYIYIFFSKLCRNPNSPFGNHRYAVRNVWVPAVHLHVGGTKECLSFLCRVYTTAVSTRSFLREGSVSHFLLPSLSGWEQHGDRWWNPACSVQGLSVRSEALLPGWEIPLSGCVTPGKSFSFPSLALWGTDVGSPG